MLVLSRRVGEVLKIGENVSITIIAIRGKQVRLGILAPTDMKVTRVDGHESHTNTAPATSAAP